jgi:hypothetical protein
MTLGTLVMMTGCAGASVAPAAPTASNVDRVHATASAHASGSVPHSGDLPALTEGPITPGTYVIMPPEDGWVTECLDGVDCAPRPPHARTLQLEITVAAGWESTFENTVIVPAAPGSTEGPDGSGLVIGWDPSGLHSDPCHPVQGHFPPDIPVGPGVEDFVNAVVAHPTLEVSEPVDAEVGGYSGRSFTLTVPSDISDCGDWRPWDPGIFAQGPDNIWNLWVIDVDGLRMILLLEEFPGTPAEDSAELQATVESIRFVPSR